jgi:hypothetical protein
MNIKLLKRSQVIKNLILFIVFSVFYLHLIYSLTKGVSAFNLLGLKENLIKEWALIMLGLTSIVSVSLGTKVSKFIYSLFFVVVLVKTSAPLLNELDKFVLIMNFAYLVFAFYYYLFWKLELDEAFYKPRFTSRDLGPRSSLPVKVKLTTSANQEIYGELTNWDKNGCFISITDSTLPKGSIKFEVEYEQRQFMDYGQVMTEYANGVGIKFQKVTSKSNVHNWLDFYDILRDRGFIFT